MRAVLAQILRGFPAWRLVGVAVIGVHAVLALVMAVQDRPQGWPVGDRAVIELYTLHAADGRQLLGAYSRFGFHHPGPAMFYALLPFYAASGYHTASLYAGALAINLLSLGLIFWTLVRVAAPLPLSLSLCVLLMAFVFRVPEILTSAWNPHLPVLPFVALLVVGAAVASGDIRLLALMATLASFVVQAHVGFAAVALLVSGAAMLAVAAASALVLERRRALARWSKRAAWALALLWALPVAEQIAYRPGNLARMAAFLLAEGEEGRVSAAIAARAWADSLMGLLHSDFRIPVGWYFTPASNPWLSSAALGTMLLLPVAAIAAWRRGFRFQAAMAALAMVAGVAGLWSVTSIRFEIFDHAVFWLSGVGVAALASAFSLPFLWAPLGRSPTHRDRTRTIASGGVLVAFAAFTGWSNLMAPSAPLGSENGAVAPFVRAIVATMPVYDIQKPLLQVDGQAWGVAAGVLLQFAKDGVPVAVDRRLVGVFDRPWLPTGEEDAVFTFADAAGHERLSARAGNIAVAEFGGYFVDTVLVP